MNLHIPKGSWIIGVDLQNHNPCILNHLGFIGIGSG